MTKGKFVTIEGPDGSGKTSVLKHLAQYLREELSLPLLTTREPGGSVIAERIREVILDVNHTAMDSRTEALLFAAQRRQHLVEKIIPAMEEGRLVISDRFIHSSLAYQGIARGIPVEAIRMINDFGIEGYQPDLVLLIDVPAEVGLERIYAARGNRQFDRLDREDVAFHSKVRQAFLDFAKKDNHIVIIDGNQSIEHVVQDCLKALHDNHIIDIN